jgi:LysM repeat protein
MSLDETSLSDAGSDRFIPAQPESRTPAQTPSWGAKRCPSCQTPVLHNQVVCAECGTRLVPRLTRVRCLRCRKRAISDHIICPHCGRELRAAPSRLLTIGLPTVLVGVLVVVLVARDVPSFLRDNDNLPLIQNFVITPVSSDSEPTVRLARESLAPAVVQSGAGQSAESPPSDAAPSAAALATPTPTPPTQESNTPATESQTQVGSQDTVMHPTETPTTAAMEPADAPTAAVAAAVETSTATPAPAPPETETAAPTATPAWKIYTIKRYDTLEEIARRFEIDLPRLLEANAIAPGEERRLQLGQEIVLPGILGETATPTATATSATTPTATPQG